MTDGAFVVAFDDDAVADVVGLSNMQFRGKDVQWEKRPQDISGEWQVESNENIIKVTQKGARAHLSIPGELSIDAEVSADGITAMIGVEKLTATLDENSSICWSD